MQQYGLIFDQNLYLSKSYSFQVMLHQLSQLLNIVITKRISLTWELYFSYRKIKQRSFKRYWTLLQQNHRVEKQIFYHML